MMTDPIADMLTRIRNAIMAKKSHVIIPHSKLKRAIAEILSVEGFVGKIEDIQEVGKPMFSIGLLYNNGMPRVETITRISKPGLRVYVHKDQIPDVCNKFGIAIISTSRGLMTGENARSNGLGGEIICTAY